MYVQPAILPDGRTIVAGYHETFGWTLRLGEIATEGPDLRVLLQGVLADHPDWVRRVHDELAGRDIGTTRRWPCACCGCFTLEEAGRSSHQICPVCFWEDDGHQFRNPASAGGANKISLVEAIENYRLHGVSEPSFSDHVRPPTPEEEP